MNIPGMCANFAPVFDRMVLCDKVCQNAEALRQVRELTLADARKAVVPVCCMDDGFGDDIVRAFPDGRRARIGRGEQGAITPISARQ